MTDDSRTCRKLIQSFVSMQAFLSAHPGLFLEIPFHYRSVVISVWRGFVVYIGVFLGENWRDEGEIVGRVSRYSEHLSILSCVHRFFLKF